MQNYYDFINRDSVSYNFKGTSEKQLQCSFTTQNCKLIKKGEAMSFFWLKNLFNSDNFSIVSYEPEMWILNGNGILNILYLITQSFKGYRCKSGIALFVWRVTWNYAYSPFMGKGKHVCLMHGKYKVNTGAGAGFTVPLILINPYLRNVSLRRICYIWRFWRIN